MYIGLGPVKRPCSHCISICNDGYGRKTGITVYTNLPNSFFNSVYAFCSRKRDFDIIHFQNKFTISHSNSSLSLKNLLKLEKAWDSNLRPMVWGTWISLYTKYCRVSMYALIIFACLNVICFNQMGRPSHLFSLFSAFKTNITIFTINVCDAGIRTPNLLNASVSSHNHFTRLPPMLLVCLSITLVPTRLFQGRVDV